MKKNTATKIMAIIALLGIILWVVSTWAMMIYETMFAPKTQTITDSNNEKVDLSKLLENTWTTISTWITK